MAQMKTPGVYVVEKNAFPNSVVEVATAVPAFIGYTEKAEKETKSLLNKPFRISSFAEYMQYFGGSPKYKFELQLAGSNTIPDLTVKKTSYTINRTDTEFRLFDAIRLFYQNGGDACYIVSVGNYTNGIEKGLLDGTDKSKAAGGLMSLEKEQEPTMVLVPDALSLSSVNCRLLYQNVISHCEKMMNRIAIFDVYNGDKDRKDPSEKIDIIEAFRAGIGTNGLKYAVANYPWVETTIVQEAEVSFTNLTDGSLSILQNLLIVEQGLSTANPPTSGTKARKIFDLLNSLPNYKTGTSTVDDMNKSLTLLSEAYRDLIKEIRKRLNVLPVASAMAGVYTMVDATRGVWKAPANVTLNAVIRPTVTITHDEQEDLNNSLTGKSINAIRSFIGLGVLVWGARTLDGNSLDWKYINVRRTMIMLEQSVKAAAKAYVF